MNRRLYPFFPAVVLLLASVQAMADGYEDARAMLERLAVAMNEMSYQGTFVYVRGKDVVTMRVTHVHDENGERERMYSMSGPHREVIRDAQGVRCVLGDDSGFEHDPLVTRSLFPELPLDGLAKAQGRYLFKTGGHTRIAGHRGSRLTIFAKDEYRYGYDLWLEEQTGLLLRWVLYDADRSTLATLMFTDLSFGENVDHGELESATPGEAFIFLETKSGSQQSPQRAERKLTPHGTPPGFRLSATSPWPNGAEQGLQHLVFSDGLASVSVYIEASEQARELREGLSRLGTLNAFSKNTGAWKITAIGEVPPITVKTFSQAFSAPLMADD